nr:gamma-gliadin-like [Leptinotarsa decemlineata]
MAFSLCVLGLQNGEDNFSSFVSAPPTAAKQPEKTETPDLTKNEEESFFNQVLPTEKEKVKLDKDSILALYANTPPTNNFNQFPQATYQQPAQNAFQGFGGFPQPQATFPMQNGITQIPPQWPQQQWGKQGQFPAQQQGQFLPNVTQPLAQFGNSQQFAAFPQQPPAANQFYQQQFQTPGFNQAPNPFFANQNLQQQFSNLNLNNQTANTGNVWQ